MWHSPRMFSSALAILIVTFACAPNRAVRHAISAYVSAVESGDLVRLKATYQALPDEQAAHWQTFFANVRHIKGSYQVISVQPDTGDDVTTTVKGRLSYTIQGQVQSTPWNFTAHLQREDGAWHIVAIR
jgi:hypothetical protein